MKRLVAAGILFILVITAYVYGYLYIENTCKIAKRYLKDCITVYAEDDDATDEAKKLEKYWSNKENGLSFFANHSKIDEIELAISSLKIYSNTKDSEIFYEYSGTVEALIHQLLEDTKPTIHSIF